LIISIVSLLGAVIQNTILLMKLMPENAAPHAIFFTDGVCAQGTVIVIIIIIMIIIIIIIIIVYSI
jgi:hypothetical protein